MWGRERASLCEKLPARPSGRSRAKIKNVYKDVRMVTELACNKKSKAYFSWKFSWTFRSYRTVNTLRLHNEKTVDEVLRDATHRLATMKTSYSVTSHAYMWFRWHPREKYGLPNTDFSPNSPVFKSIIFRPRAPHVTQIVGKYIRKLRVEIHLLL